MSKPLFCKFDGEPFYLKPGERPRLFCCDKHCQAYHKQRSEAAPQSHECKGCETIISYETGQQKREFCVPSCRVRFYQRNLKLERALRAQHLADVPEVSPLSLLTNPARDAAAYGSERYDAPGRTVSLAPARRMSPIYGTHVYQESTAAMASG